MKEGNSPKDLERQRNNQETCNISDRYHSIHVKYKTFSFYVFWVCFCTSSKEVPEACKLNEFPFFYILQAIALLQPHVGHHFAGVSSQGITLGANFWAYVIQGCGRAKMFNLQGNGHILDILWKLRAPQDSFH